jgi:hypothetical protein
MHRRLKGFETTSDVFETIPRAQYYRIKSFTRENRFALKSSATPIQLTTTFTFDMVIPGSKIRDDATLKSWVIRLAPNGVGVRFDKRSGRERRCDLDRRTGRDRRHMTRAQKRKLRAF